MKLTHQAHIHLQCVARKNLNSGRMANFFLINGGSEPFVKANSLSDDGKKYAAQDYENNKDEFSKDWSDLSESAKEKYYTKYAKENNIVDEDAKTYEEWQYSSLETFVDRYTSKSGDKIVAFGEYGYDG